MFHRSVLAAAALLLHCSAAIAVPFTPTSDAQVLETLPTRAGDPSTREVADLRRRLMADPKNADLAVRLARTYFTQVAAEGDPRYIGYAQAALAPWWDRPDPPVDVRVTRAILRQFNHEFDPALADLDAALREDSENGDAWAWRTAIDMVQTHYDRARLGCQKLAPQTAPPVAVACTAAIDSLTGKAAAAATGLRQSLLQNPQISAASKLWAWTRLAEIEDRVGQAGLAEAAYRQALSQGIVDGYLLAAYADFLLDHGRAREVLSLLKDKERSDLLLLRLAIAAKATGAPQLQRWTAELAARFDAAKLRGDTVHQKEEARFALAVQGQAQRALVLAQQNYAVQREPSDARILLEAAAAAGQPAAAAPALRWMKETGIESVRLRAAAAALQGKAT